MPFRMITEKVIEIGTSFFIILSSGHYDLPDRNMTPIHSTAVTAVQTLSETASTVTTTTTTAEPKTSSSTSENPNKPDHSGTTTTPSAPGSNGGNNGGGRKSLLPNTGEVVASGLVFSGILVLAGAVGIKRKLTRQ